MAEPTQLLDEKVQNALFYPGSESADLADFLAPHSLLEYSRL
jgi:hypothetical protein